MKQSVLNRQQKIFSIVIALLALVVIVVNTYAANSTPTPSAVEGATWTLDTVGVITTGKVRIRTIYWVDCTTNGHSFIINDAAGNLIWKDTDGEAGIGHLFYIDRVVTGVTLNTLGSGTLIIDVAPVRY
ncbi:MAG TPA: hypothetical protein PKM59_01960 [Thermodesulfobacteriota bacterium]|nr:hypothetical protein [Thermodesulfobacteriota bacterium]HNU70578.1 hypothetical protein [Thermodesulfobacteriota bacterium]